MYNYTEEILEKLRQAASCCIQGLGYELVDLTLSRSQGALVLKFLVDRPDGGISIAECASLNEQLGILLEKENILEERYVLEVSSPGVDRPLVNEKDFWRALGRWVRVFLNEPIKGKMEMEGIIDKVEDKFLFLKTGKVAERIPLSGIRKAKQVIK